MNYDSPGFNAFNTEGVEIDDVKVYVPDIQSYLAECYTLYSKLFINHNEQINNLVNQAQTASRQDRKRSIEAIAAAMTANLKNVLTIKNILSQFLSFDDIIRVKLNPNDDLISYLKDYQYMRRDWGGDRRSQYQLSIINAVVKTALHNVENKKIALFLGAGAGRIALDLADEHEKIYMTDKSFSMAWHFNKLKQGSKIQFYEINAKNVAKIDHQLNFVTASLQNIFTEREILRQLPKIDYFVSDALNLPLKDKAVSIVYSVYFTDVIALKLLLPEVSRVLVPGGTFIHIGPLDYFFSDIREALTCEEVRSFFEDNSFVTVTDKFVETEHLPSEVSLSNKLYNNWVFVARYEPKTDKIFTIDISTIFTLNKAVKYTISGQIGSNNVNIAHNILMPDGEEFEGAETAIDILRLVDGHRSAGDIFQDISEVYGKFSADEVQSLLMLMQKLLDKKVISVFNP